MYESSADNLTQLQQKYDGNYTNQVLVHAPEDSKKIVYYLPVYLRMTVRRVHHIELQSSVAQVSGTLIFSIYYKGLPGNEEMEMDSDEEESDEWKETKSTKKPWYLNDLTTKVELKINGQDGFIFDSSKDIFVQNSLNISHDKEKHMLNYTIRDTFECDVDGNIVLTPFETLNLYTEFSLRTVECSFTKNKKKVQLKFNMMDTDNDSVKLDIRPRTSTGDYGIGQKKCSMVYTNSEETYNKYNPEVHKGIFYGGDRTNLIEEKLQNFESKKSSNKITYWQHANVKLVLYKHPMTTIFSIMMPMWILAIIVQLSFFQQNQLAGRIATVAIALVAYMAFIPSVRQKLPPSPNFTFIEIVIFLLLVTSMLTAARAFIDSGITDYEYVWYQDPLFIITLVLNCATFLATVIITILFFVYFKKQYTDDSKAVQKQNFSFKRENWKNQRADMEFRSKTTPALHNTHKRISAKLKPIEERGKQSLKELVL